MMSRASLSGIQDGRNEYKNYLKVRMWQDTHIFHQEICWGTVRRAEFIILFEKSTEFIKNTNMFAIDCKEISGEHDYFGTILLVNFKEVLLWSMYHSSD